MRKTLLFLIVSGFLASAVLSADAAARQKMIRYFGAWYAYYPGSRVSATETKDVEIPGLEAYRLERHSESKAHQEFNYALYDRASDEVFVGEILYDGERHSAGKPFDPTADLPNIQASLRELFGLQLEVTLRGSPRGALRPLELSVRQEKDAEAKRSGFVSEDGAALLLGEFQSASRSAAEFREKLLTESAGVRNGEGRFTVTEFLDFQCDRCRVRTPDVRRAVEQRGGTVEIRFLPLVKVHNWAFAAAESAAALAGIKPELYRRFEEAIFARAEGMSAAAARELASDIAEAAGAREAFTAELSSGRARARVLHDIGLAMRLGVVATPAFLYHGTLLAGEKGLLETYLSESLPASARKTPGRAE